MLHEPGPEDLPEIIGEWLIVIRNVEADQSLPLELSPEALLDPILVTLLHHEDRVSPPYVPCRQLDPSVRVRAGGSNLVLLRAVEQRLRGNTANAILATDEEQLLSSRHWAT